jgi:ribosomal protein S18 acetylase RimI-like enzyme
MQIHYPVSLKDFERIAEIYNSAIKPFYNISSIQESKDYRSLMTQTALDFCQLTQSKIFCCATLDNRIVGFAYYYIKNTDIIWINSLYVDPAFQNKGIGTFLLNSLCRDNINCGLIALETHAEAEWAISFYIKNGFAVVNDVIESPPYDRIFNKPPVIGRPILAKIISHQ